MTVPVRNGHPTPAIWTAVSSSGAPPYPGGRARLPSPLAPSAAGPTKKRACRYRAGSSFRPAIMGLPNALSPDALSKVGQQRHDQSEIRDDEVFHCCPPPVGFPMPSLAGLNVHSDSLLRQAAYHRGQLFPDFSN